MKRAMPTSVLRLSQDLLHLLALGQFIDEFVEIANLPHRGLFDLFDADTADDTFYERSCGIHSRGFGEERFEIDLVLQYLFELALAVAGEPEDDFIHFGLRASFSLRLGNVKRIDA